MYGWLRANEVCIFGEVDDNSENDRFSMDLRETLDEVYGDVGPHFRQHVKQLNETRRLQGRCLVVLACDAHADVILNERPLVEDVEIGAQS
jgi:hypothetical protein